MEVRGDSYLLPAFSNHCTKIALACPVTQIILSVQKWCLTSICNSATEPETSVFISEK